MENIVNFKVSSHLKNIIGKDLITNRYVAIYELVKNSLDAEATEVIIEIKKDYIIIKDNGIGMSLEDIKNKWLFVGYSEKKKRDVGKYAGNKGIGRFSSDTLGCTLVMNTKKKGYNGISLTMDWNQFESDQLKKIENIDMNYEINENIDLGTKLKITDLRDEWDESNVKKLKDYLSKLKNPFEISEAVNIELITEYKEFNGSIGNDILEILINNSIVLSVIIKDNKISSELKHNERLLTEFQYNNDTMFKDLKLEIFHMSRGAKLNFTKKMGTQFTNYGNIFVYRNGYRVLPYGEIDYDIFNLNLRKSQGYNRYLGTRDLIGYIAIQDDDNKFIEVSARDGGFIINESYLELENLYMEYHKFLEDIMKITAFNKIESYEINKNMIKRFKNKNDLNYKLGKTKKSPDVKEVMHKIEKKIELTETDIESLKDLEVLKKQDEKVLKEVEKDNRKLKKENKIYEKEIIEKNRLINEIDSTSEKQAILEHHLNITVNYMSSIMKKLKRDEKELLELEGFREFDVKYYESLNKLKSLRNLIRDINYDTRAATTNDLVQFIEEYSKKRAKNNTFEIDVYTNNYTYEAKYDAITLIIILDNLIDNAISFDASILKIVIEKNGFFEIKFITDTAKKTEVDMDRIFDYGYTTKKRGTGNGMFFVEKLVKDEFSGSVEVYTSGEQFITAIKLPIKN